MELERAAEAAVGQLGGHGRGHRRDEQTCRARLWDVAAPQLLKELGPAGPGMWDVAYSPDGRTQACGGSVVRDHGIPRIDRRPGRSLNYPANSK